ncbi:rRNA N6-adenosine-methyltransferase METTL5 [Anopheles nili]|uniref:rRNA N6-adenosine-methyltransferase METTL5 n=1 Tax=Anopheles nili TaxID=185578 RepID=UPI00237BD9DC|nr:rRNA N6-adenosine-methyltransferase METTL5 [Anopheles nili]
MAACIKLRKLEHILEMIDDFGYPKINLEQYSTPSHIAAQALYSIQTKFGDMQGKDVLDLGCGPGILSIGAALLGAKHVLGVDIDSNALEIFECNCEGIELDNISSLEADVLKLPENLPKHSFDTVILNPPFGTKQNNGIDVAFLKVATEMSRGAIYSMHKTTTRQYIKKKGKEWKVPGLVLAQLRFNLPKIYHFHRAESKDIAVDLWRFEVPKQD